MSFFFFSSSKKKFVQSLNRSCNRFWCDVKVKRLYEQKIQKTSTCILKEIEKNKLKYKWLNNKEVENNEFVVSKKVHKFLKKELNNVTQYFNQAPLQRLETSFYDELRKYDDIINGSGEKVEVQMEMQIGDFQYFMIKQKTGFQNYYRKNSSLAKNLGQGYDRQKLIDTEKLTARENSIEKMEVKFIKFSLDCKYMVYGYGSAHSSSFIDVIQLDDEPLAYDYNGAELPMPSVLLSLKDVNNAEIGGSTASGETLLYFTTCNSQGRPNEIRKRKFSSSRLFSYDQIKSDRFIDKLPLCFSKTFHAKNQGIPSYLSALNMENQIIFKEDDPRFFVDVSRTKNGKFITINSHSKTSSEVWVINNEPTRDQIPQLVQKRTMGLRYYVEHVDQNCIGDAASSFMGNIADSQHQQTCNKKIKFSDFFLLVTTKLNEDSKNLVLMKTHTLEGKVEDWEEWFYPDRDTIIEDVDVHPKFCVIYCRSSVTGDSKMSILLYDKNCPGSISIHNLNNIPAYNHPYIVTCESNSSKTINNYYKFDITFPEGRCVLSPCPSISSISDTFRFHLSSPIMPSVTYEVNTKSCSLQIVQNASLIISNLKNQTSLDLSMFEVGLVFAKNAIDNVEIPITVIHKKGICLDSSNKMICYVYGAYGEILQRNFSFERLPLLNDDWVIALCHVRGGGELGDKWHSQGKLTKKINSFYDFEACIKYLQNIKCYSNASQTVIHGSSAGGLLVGDIFVNKPELIKCAVMRSPFLDIVGEMLDSDRWLTEHEFDEWGNPGESEDILKCMYSYSPFESISYINNFDKTDNSTHSKYSDGKDFPNLYISTNLVDPVVPFCHSVKFTLEIRKQLSMVSRNRRNVENVLLNINPYEEGHVTMSWGDISAEYSFIYDSLQLQQKNV